MKNIIFIYCILIIKETLYKYIINLLFIEVLNYLGNEIVEDYNNFAEDTLMLVGIFHLAKSYYVMKEIGYYYSFKEKKSISKIKK